VAIRKDPSITDRNMYFLMVVGFLYDLKRRFPFKITKLPNQFQHSSVIHLHEMIAPKINGKEKVFIS